MPVRLNLYGTTLTREEEDELRAALVLAGFCRQEVDWAVGNNLDLNEPLIMRLIDQRIEDVIFWMRQFRISRAVAIRKLGKQTRIKNQMAHARREDYYNIFRTVSP